MKVGAEWKTYLLLMMDTRTAFEIQEEENCSRSPPVLRLPTYAGGTRDGPKCGSRCDPRAIMMIH